MSQTPTGIVTCSCGTTVQVPEDADARTFLCPKCQKTLLTTVDRQILVTEIAREQAGQTCPVCMSVVGAEDRVVSCTDCDQLHHQECWAEIGGCSTYGCKQAPAVAEKDAPDEQPRAAWGDTKQCPACGESIKAIALKCRYCDTEFSTIDPLKAGDLRRQAGKQESLKKLRQQAGFILALSVIGCLSPIMLIVTLIWVSQNKGELEKAGPTFLVMGYVSIGVSAVYCVLIALFAVMEVAK